MARRYSGKMNGERYLGDINTLKVHDLDNEKANCQIDAIIQRGHEWPFKLLEIAHKRGMDNCRWCIGKPKR